MWLGVTIEFIIQKPLKILETRVTPLMKTSKSQSWGSQKLYPTNTWIQTIKPSSTSLKVQDKLKHVIRCYSIVHNTKAYENFRDTCNPIIKNIKNTKLGKSKAKAILATTTTLIHTIKPSSTREVKTSDYVLSYVVGKYNSNWTF